MKKHITIVLILLINYSFSQENIFKKMPFFIGDKIDLKIFTEPIDFKTKNFSLMSYGASDDNIINRLILSIYDNKAFDNIESFFQSNQNWIKVSHLKWEKSFTECYIDKTKDIEVVIKYSPGYDSNFIGNMQIISYKFLESNLEKTYNKLNNQSVYLTTRYYYLTLGEKESILLNFRFNSKETDIYGIITLFSDKSHELKSINFRLKDDEVITKQLTAIEKNKARQWFY